MTKSLESIEDEIEEFIQSLKEVTSESSKILLYLKGWKVFYSPKKIRPKVLFIGINPGAGELKNPFFFDREEHLLFHYLDKENNNYPLAQNTRKLFERMKSIEVLSKNSVKINSRFYATKDVSSMFEFEQTLKIEHNNLYEKLMYLNQEWLKKIINIIKPEIIICEGAASFRYLDETIFVNETGWKYELEYESNKICGYFRREDNLVLFGYSRNPVNYDEEFISKYLEPLLLEKKIHHKF